MASERRPYVVVSVATVTHMATVWSDDAESARRQADGHLHTMVTMKPQGGGGYNPNITQMESVCGVIASYAKESADAS